MNEAATMEPISQVQPTPPVAVAEMAAAQLASLARARDITDRMLRRIDQVAEAMAPDELKAALADNGQMALNLTRIDRALRQIVVLELETMGLREPPEPRGTGQRAGGNGGGGNGNRGAGGRLNDLNDLSDPKDLNDLYNELHDLEEFSALFDLNDQFDAEDWDDLDALRTYDSYEAFTAGRKNKMHEFTEEDEIELEQRLLTELEKYDPANRPTLTTEEKQANMRALDAELRASMEEDHRKAEVKWKARRAVLERHGLTIKTRKRAGRGPPRR
jgi:hypothetical protein